jgi:hypothetical protein
VRFPFLRSKSYYAHYTTPPPQKQEKYPAGKKDILSNSSVQAPRIYTAGWLFLDKNIDCITTGNTALEIASYYDGEITLMELIKNSLKRDAQSVLRQLENPEIAAK